MSAHKTITLERSSDAPVREFIVIRREGSDVIASHKREDEIVKTAKAKCAPSDEFNFDTGAKLAFDRLVGREEPQPKPAANPYAKYFTHSVEAEKRSELKVGDRVYHKSNGMGTVVGFEYDGTSWVWCMYDSENSRPYPALSCHLRKIVTTTPAPKFKVGDRVVCDEFGEGIVELVNYEFLPQTAYIICLKNERRAIVDECDLSPAPEPKYYTGRVVCISGEYGIGKIYTVVNGRFTDKTMNIALPYKSVEHMNDTFLFGKVAEVKE